MAVDKHQRHMTWGVRGGTNNNSSMVEPMGRQGHKLIWVEGDGWWVAN